MRHLIAIVGLALSLAMASPALAVRIQVSQTDFSETFPLSNNFNQVNFFAFDLDLAGVPNLGQNQDPGLTSIDYQVNGTLTDPTPSTFPSFNLVRSETGAAFYGLQSTESSVLRFDIAAGANRSNGVQLSELDPFSVTLDAAGENLSFSDVIFYLNAREEGTGRFHPPILLIFDDGSALLQNANNIGGDNPQDNPDGGEIDVAFGAEYIVDLTIGDSLTLIDVPLPPAGLLLGCALMGLAVARRRRLLSQI